VRVFAPCDFLYRRSYVPATSSETMHKFHHSIQKCNCSWSGTISVCNCISAIAYICTLFMAYVQVKIRILVFNISFECFWRRIHVVQRYDLSWMHYSRNSYTTTCWVRTSVLIAFYLSGLVEVGGTCSSCLLRTITLLTKVGRNGLNKVVNI